MDKEARARHLRSAAKATATTRAELEAVWQEEKRPARRLTLADALECLRHVADVIKSEL